MTQIYLDVPYVEKDMAKVLGAKWDARVKKWYVPVGVDRALFGRWLPEERTSIYIVVGEKRCWNCKEKTTVVALGVPYGEPYQLSEDDIAEGVYSGYDPSTYDALALLPRLAATPKELRDYLEERYSYKPKYSKTTKLLQLNNCCDCCDALLGEFFEFNEPDGCFFINDESDLEKLRFYELEVPGAIFGFVNTWSSMDEATFAYAKNHSEKVDIKLIEDLFI